MESYSGVARRITQSVLVTVYRTSTFTSLIYVSSYDVSTVTRIESNIDTVTVTSADRVTEMVTITISSAALRARASATASPSPITVHRETPQRTLHSAITNVPSLGIGETDTLVAAPCTGGGSPRESGSPGSVLHKRQTTQYTRTITTGTTTSFYVVKSVTTSTIRISSVSYTTTTISRTSTTVLQAVTIIRSTTATNIARAGPTTPTATIEVGPLSEKQRLSTGAKAGTGASVGAAAIAALLLAGCLWRKRKQRRHPEASGNDQPVLAASPPTQIVTNYGENKMLREPTVAPSSTAYRPAPPSSSSQFSPTKSPGPYVYEGYAYSGLR